MQEKIALSAEVRQQIGKQNNKHLREQGFVPAVVYRHGKETVSLKVAKDALHAVLHTEHGENVMIALNVTGEKAKKERLVMIKEVQLDVLKNSVLHVDFHEISLTEKIKVDIPIETKGEPVGVKQDGGVLEHTMREVEAECLPTQIPDYIEIDVEALQIGDSRHVRDLPIPPGVKILSDPDLTILAVKLPHVEKEEPVEGEEGAAEPEVIGEKKEGEEEGSEEGEKPKPAAPKAASEEKKKEEK